MAKTSKSTWKKFENRVAKYFGSVRTALSGGNSKITRSDSLHDELFIECKSRASHSAVSLWRKTKELSKKEGKIPVVVLGEKNKTGFWILCHESDLIDIATCREVAKLEKSAEGNT